MGTADILAHSAQALFIRGPEFMIVRMIRKMLVPTEHRDWETESILLIVPELGVLPDDQQVFAPLPVHDHRNVFPHALNDVTSHPTMHVRTEPMPTIQRATDEWIKIILGVVQHHTVLNTQCQWQVLHDGQTPLLPVGWWHEIDEALRLTPNITHQLSYPEPHFIATGPYEWVYGQSVLTAQAEWERATYLHLTKTVFPVTTHSMFWVIDDHGLRLKQFQPLTAQHMAHDQNGIRATSLATLLPFLTTPRTATTTWQEHFQSVYLDEIWRGGEWGLRPIPPTVSIPLIGEEIAQ